MGTFVGDVKFRLPLTKAVFTLVLAQLCRLPGLPPSADEIDLGGPVSPPNATPRASVDAPPARTAPALMLVMKTAAPSG